MLPPVADVLPLHRVLQSSLTLQIPLQNGVHTSEVSWLVGKETWLDAWSDDPMTPASP